MGIGLWLCATGTSRESSNRISLDCLSFLLKIIKHSFPNHLIDMSSLAGALDGYTHPRHPKTHYHHTSDDIDMTVSKNDPEAQDDDEEMDDDLFGNDNDVEEQKRLRSVQFRNCLHFILPFFSVFSVFPEHRPHPLPRARIPSVYLLPNENGDRPWNMKKKMHLRKFQLRSRKPMSLFRISLFLSHLMATSVPCLISSPVDSFLIELGHSLAKLRQVGL